MPFIKSFLSLACAFRVSFPICPFSSSLRYRPGWSMLIVHDFVKYPKMRYLKHFLDEACSLRQTTHSIRVFTATNNFCLVSAGNQIVNLGLYQTHNRFFAKYLQFKLLIWRKVIFSYARLFIEVLIGYIDLMFFGTYCDILLKWDFNLVT